MHATPDPAFPSTFSELSYPAPAQVIALWDPHFSTLWSLESDRALQAAALLYAPKATLSDLTPRETELIAWFRQHLLQEASPMPSTPEARYHAVVTGVRLLLQHVRENRTQPFLEDALEIALRPVRHLQTGMLTSAVCAALYDYHRGVWTPHLTRPQRQKIQAVLAAALASLPPDEMEVFWQNLHCSNALLREAMCLGLEWLTADHAVPHLLCGLDLSPDSGTRFTIVDNLARIGDLRALPRLYALRRTSALTDWPLSRRIATAIGVIEHLNRGHSSPRSLLRPAQAPPPDPATLLRPTAETEASHTHLLRPIDPPQ